MLRHNVRPLVVDFTHALAPGPNVVSDDVLSAVIIIASDLFVGLRLEHSFGRSALDYRNHPRQCRLCEELQGALRTGVAKTVGAGREQLGVEVVLPGEVCPRPPEPRFASQSRSMRVGR